MPVLSTVWLVWPGPGMKCWEKVTGRAAVVCQPMPIFFLTQQNLMKHWGSGGKEDSNHILDRKQTLFCWLRSPASADAAFTECLLASCSATPGTGACVWVAAPLKSPGLCMFTPQCTLWPSPKMFQLPHIMKSGEYLLLEYCVKP